MTLTDAPSFWHRPHTGAWLTPQIQNLVARQSSDSPYLFYCINPDNRWEHFVNTVFKIRFKLPKIPDGLYSVSFLCVCVNQYEPALQRTVRARMHNNQ